MTTIAYRDGVLAADSLVTSRGEALGHGVKIGRSGPLLFGACGSQAWGWLFRSWMMGGAVGAHPPVPNEHSGGFIVLPNDDLILFHVEGMERRLTVPFYADGSGADFAIGAMQVGASAEEAVRAAEPWDTRTGGQILVLRR